MNKLFKTAAAFLLVLCFCFSYRAPVFAESNEQRLAEEAGSFISGLLELISEKYAGGPYDIEKLGRAAIDAVMAELDPYSEYLDPQEYNDLLASVNSSFTGIGVSLEKRGSNVYIKGVTNGSSAANAGIMAGDMLYKIEDTYVAGKSVSEVQARIAQQGTEPFKISVIRDFKNLSFEVSRGKIEQGTVFTTDMKLLGEKAAKLDNCGYIRMTTVGLKTCADFEAAIEGLISAGKDTLILDLRNNSGGYLNIAVDICGLIVPEGPVIFTQEKDGDKTAVKSELKEPPFAKIYIIVNKNTASSAEVIASALQDSGIGVIVGVKTFGKGVIQSLYELTDGSCIKLTTSEYFRRNGKKLNNIGVIPDIFVTPSDDSDAFVEAVFTELLKTTH